MIIIGIFACSTVEKYVKYIHKINNTWRKKAEEYGIKVLYFFGEEVNNYFIGPEYIYLKDVKDDYLSASYKQALGLKYIYDNYKKSIEYVHIIGLDTYINIPKYLECLQSIGVKNKLYLGGHGSYRLFRDKNIYFHCGGAGFTISFDVLEHIYDRLDKMVDEWNDICNLYNNNNLYTACDVCISYYLQIDDFIKEKDMIKHNGFYNCNYKGLCYNNTYVCCGDKVDVNNIISCHNMTYEDFDLYTDILDNIPRVLNYDIYTGSVAVTMFFNIKKYSDNKSSVRDSDFYKINCNTTLSIKNPLVVLCDKESQIWIKEIRERLSDSPTYYIVKDLNEYDHYKDNYSIILKNRKDSKVYNDSKNRANPSYFLLMMIKFIAIKKAHDIYKNASHYFWIDFACQHIAWEAKQRIDSILINPNPKVSALYIHYRSSSELHNMEEFLKDRGLSGIAATVFSVENKYVDVFYTRCFSIFYEMISRGVGHSDEQILTYLYDRFPDMFMLYYGDYYSVISNYKYIIRDYNAIRSYFIKNAINANRKDLIKELLKVLTESYNSGYGDIDKSDLLFLNNYLKSINIKQIDMDFGKSILESAVSDHPECETAKELLNNFIHFKKIYEILEGKWEYGWGSYMFNGLEYKWQRETLKKQEALFNVAKKVNNVLEIGVYLGHSLLLMLIANPKLRITCIDNDQRFSPKVVSYLNKVFNNRILFIQGSAEEVLPVLFNHNELFDLIHIDADHTDKSVRKYYELSKHSLLDDGYIVFDDYEATRDLIDKFIEEDDLSVVTIPWTLWTNIVLKKKLK